MTSKYQGWLSCPGSNDMFHYFPAASDKSSCLLRLRPETGVPRRKLNASELQRACPVCVRDVCRAKKIAAKRLRQAFAQPRQTFLFGARKG